jgi:hypothetical protein
MADTTGVRTKEAVQAEIEKLREERGEAGKEARRTQNVVKDLVSAARGFSFTGPEAEAFLQANADAQTAARQVAKEASERVKQLRGREEALFTELEAAYLAEEENQERAWLKEREERIKNWFPHRLWNSAVRPYEASLILLERNGSLFFTRDIDDEEYGDGTLSAADEAALFEVLQSRALGKDS